MADNLEKISAVLGIPFSELIDTSRYEYIRGIGSGTFSDVSLERSPDLNEVAVKEYRLGIRDLKEASLNEMKAEFELRKKSFQREFKTYKKVQHNQIPLFHGVGAFSRERGKFLEFQPKLILEFIDGETLSDKIKNGGLSSEDIRKNFFDVLNPLEALHYANSKPIFHRDLKPANLKINSEGLIYLLDFGTVRDELLKTNRGSMAVGTLGYVHPKQFEGEPSFRTDLYSLAATFYAVSVGKELEAYERLSSELLEQTNLDQHMKKIIYLLYDFELRGPQNIKELRDYLERPIEVRGKDTIESENVIGFDKIFDDVIEKGLQELDLLFPSSNELKPFEIEEDKKLTRLEVESIEKKLKDNRTSRRLSLISGTYAAAAMVSPMVGILIDPLTGLIATASAGFGIRYLHLKNKQRGLEEDLNIVNEENGVIRTIKGNLYEAKQKLTSYKKTPNIILPAFNLLGTYFLCTESYTVAGIYYGLTSLIGLLENKPSHPCEFRVKDLEKQLQQTIEESINTRKEIILKESSLLNKLWNSRLVIKLWNYHLNAGERLYETSVADDSSMTVKDMKRLAKRKELFALVAEDPKRKARLEEILQDHEIPIKPQSFIKKLYNEIKGIKGYYEQFHEKIEEYHDIYNFQNFNLTKVKKMIKDAEILRILGGIQENQDYTFLYETLFTNKKSTINNASDGGNSYLLETTIKEIREIERDTGIDNFSEILEKNFRKRCKRNYKNFISFNLDRDKKIKAKQLELKNSGYDLNIWDEFMELTEEWCSYQMMDMEYVPKEIIKKSYLTTPARVYTYNQLTEYRTTVLNEDLEFTDVTRKIGYFRNFAKERNINWDEHFQEQEKEIIRVAAAKSNRLMVLNSEL
ncbi:protein kinase [archaeon]|nr:protein kinase [archaeon]